VERVYREKLEAAELEHRSALVKWQARVAAWLTSEERRELAVRLEQATELLRQVDVEQFRLRQRCMVARQQAWKGVAIRAALAAFLIEVGFGLALLVVINAASALN
jgi:hypothetical protein